MLIKVNTSIVKAALLVSICLLASFHYYTLFKQEHHASHGSSKIALVDTKLNVLKLLLEQKQQLLRQNQSEHQENLNHIVAEQLKHLQYLRQQQQQQVQLQQHELLQQQQLEQQLQQQQQVLLHTPTRIPSVSSRIKHEHASKAPHHHLSKQAHTHHLHPQLPEDKHQLPTFSVDKSEYLYGSIIEREFQSNDLYIDVFFISHLMFDKSTGPTGVKKVHTSSRQDWKTLMGRPLAISSVYVSTGVRKTIFQCRIKNSASSQAYNVPGLFMPNRLTHDANSNRQFDILRCPMNHVSNNTVVKYHLARNDLVSVEIIKEPFLSSSEIPKSIASYNISWITRRSGYLLTSQHVSSRLNAWKGLDGTEAVDRLHLCVSMNIDVLTSNYVMRFLTFVSHHILIGADHIYLSISFSWASDEMRHLLVVFQSFIQEGRVTLLSQAADGYNGIQSAGGLVLTPGTVGILHSNLCTYLSRGMATYLMVLNIDDLIIPKARSKGIPEVVTYLETQNSLRISATLPALKKHPYCYYHIQEEFYDSKSKMMSYSNSNRQIYPTQYMFQIGIVTGSACRLEPRYTSCSTSTDKSMNKFCGNSRNIIDVPTTVDASGSIHDFYEVVGSEDIFQLDQLEHVSVYRYNFLLANESEIYRHESFVTNYLPQVMNDLNNRNLTSSVTAFTAASVKLSRHAGQWVDFQFDVPVAKKGIARVTVQPLDYDNYKLPNDYKNRSNENIVTLPNFAQDFSDYYVGSLIERKSDSYELHVTTFLLCHKLIQVKLPIGHSSSGVELINPDVWSIWKAFMNRTADTMYDPAGIRSTSNRYQCRITHSNASRPYVVDGHFVGNSLSSDYNSNRRWDILRCKMEDAKASYMKYARSGDQVLVEILYDKKPVIKFNIPWSKRTAGSFGASPEEGGRFDAWKGFNSSIDQDGTYWPHDKINMCVPGLESALSSYTIPRYLEFVQHHLLQGISHMFLGMSFYWGSPYMDVYAKVFETYVKDNLVTIDSLSDDNIDFHYTFGGLIFGRDNLKNYHVNMCTYFNKGVADYVGVWDVDEFFIPRGSNKNIIDVLEEADYQPQEFPLLSQGNDLFTPRFDFVDAVDRLAYMKNLSSYWQPRRGWADGHGHPLCSIVLESEVTLIESGMMLEDVRRPWVGQQFPHAPQGKGMNLGLGFMKSIRPTRHVFQGGLHVAGVCALPYPWNSCKSSNTSICLKNSLKRLEESYIARPLAEQGHFSIDQAFDEMLIDLDAKTINSSRAVINHVQYHRPHFYAHESVVNVDGEYAMSHYPQVYQELRKRGLTLAALDLPQTAQAMPTHPMSYIEDEYRSRVNHTVHSQVLPAHFTDYSGFAVGAIIQRAFDSYDMCISVFLVSQSFIQRHDHIDAAWVKAKEPTHAHSLTKYVCRIKNSHGDDPSYTVDGVVQGIDGGSDVSQLRCPIINGSDAYAKFAGSTDHASVEVLRDGAVLLSFDIPWSSRVNSLLMMQHGVNGTNFDSWTGYDRSKRDNWAYDTMHVHTSPLKLLPGKDNVGKLLEFIEHHLSLPYIQHICLNTPVGVRSEEMRRYLSILESYIDAGKVSITSGSATDMVDYTYSMKGLLLPDHAFLMLHHLLLKFFSIGMTSSIIYLDANALLIPGNSSAYSIDALVLNANEAAAGNTNCSYSKIVVHQLVIASSAETKHRWYGAYLKNSSAATVIHTPDASAEVEILLLRKYALTPCAGSSNNAKLVNANETIVYRFAESSMNATHQRPMLSKEINRYKPHYAATRRSIRAKNFDLLVLLPEATLRPDVLRADRFIKVKRNKEKYPNREQGDWTLDGAVLSMDV